jgi:general secretion pathway protein H
MRSEIHKTLRPLRLDVTARRLADRHTHRGFTLIEIMVILLILTITLGLIGVNLGRSDTDRVRDEADRLVLRLGAARDEAILQGRILAVEFEANGYRFLRVDDKGRLTPIEGDDSFGAYSLPEGMTLAVRLDGAPDTARSGLVFDPSGELPAFTLTLRIGQAAWQAQTDGGRLKSRAAGPQHAG